MCGVRGHCVPWKNTTRPGARFHSKLCQWVIPPGSRSFNLIPKAEPTVTARRLNEKRPNGEGKSGIGKQGQGLAEA